MDRDNQQKTLSESELGWLGGIIDGEGTISIHRMFSHGKNITLSPRISIPNTNIIIFSKVCSILDSLDIGRHVEKRDNKKNNKWKDCYIAQISNITGTKKFLDKMMQYFFGKKDQAELVLSFCNSRINTYENTHCKRSPYTEEEKNMYFQSIELNRKGKKEDSQRLHANLP